MATTEVTSKDRERYARARALGEARAQDPSAVVGARYDATEVMQGVTEVLAYGTAVFVEPIKN